jgi:hypothetical protein
MHGRSFLSFALCLGLSSASSLALAQDDAELPPEDEAAPAQPEEPDAAEPPEDPLDAMTIPSTELEPNEEQAPDAEDAEPPKATKKSKTKTKTEAQAKTAAKPPPIVMTSTPPDELEYIEGGVIPEGYERGERMRTGLVIGGAITFLIPYLSSVAIALGANHDARRGMGSAQRAEELAVLYAPIAGPFIAIGTTHSYSAERMAPFIASGVVQAAGVSMLLAGVLSRKPVLVRKQTATVAPLVSDTMLGIGANGSF